jgi:tyrosyl-tRNA synthetase
VGEAPETMFGKLMSISDQLMARYYDLLLCEPVPAELHPMEAKKQLAARIVERYHGADAATRARGEFELRFSKRDLDSADLPDVKIEGPAQDIVTVVVAAYAQGFNITKSRGDARRLVEQGSIQLRGEKIADPKATPSFAAGDVLKLDKTRAVRLIA